MPKKMQLNIDNPCTESWDQMTPSQEGRFCGSCQKTVVDFTHMTDQQLIHWFSGSRGPVCGRLQTDQLGRSLHASTVHRQTAIPVWRYIIAGLLLSSKGSAQASPLPMMEVQQQRTLPGSYTTGDTIQLSSPQRTGLPDTLHGRVVDSTNGQGLPGASVMIGPKKGYVTDAGGYFSIPSSAVRKSTTLKIAYVGYLMKEIKIADTWKDGTTQTISLGINAVNLGEIVVCAGAVSIRRKPSILKDTLSKVANVLTAPFTKKNISIYPNPVYRGNSITISGQLNDPGNYTVQLISVNGAVMGTMEIEGVKNTTTTLMTIPSTLSPGIYFVRLSHVRWKNVFSQELVVY